METYLSNRALIILLLLSTVGLLVFPNRVAAELLLEPRGPYCQRLSISNWSEPEKWVWQQVCEKGLADFNLHYGITLNPKKPNGWSKRRELSTGFMRDILEREQLRKALPTSGIPCIKGALFRESIILSGVVLKGGLCLEQSRFENEIILSRAKIGMLELSGSTTAGIVDMSAAKIETDLHMHNGNFKEVALTGAKVGRLLNLQAVKVKGSMNMELLEVRGVVLMRQGAEFTDVNLFGAKIGSYLDLNGSKIASKLTLQAAEIGGSLVMNSSKFRQLSNLQKVFAQIR